MSFLGNIVNGIGKAIGSVGNAFTGGIFGLAEAGVNAYSQNKANKTNLEIAQMNNQYNERMMEKQMAYNTDMWNKENAYNTASSQVQRLKDAGLNPYMALSGSSSAGMATGANGVTAPTAQAANVQAYNSGGQITQALQQGYLADLATQKQKVDINVLQQQMQLKTLETMSELANKRWDTMTKKEQAKWQQIQNTFAHDLHQTEIDNRRIQYQIMFEESKEAAANATMAIMRAQRFPEQLSNELALQAADLATRVAQERLYKQTAETEFYNTWKTKLQGQKQSQDNQLMRDTWHAALNEAYLRGVPSSPFHAAAAGSDTFKRNYNNDWIPYKNDYNDSYPKKY